MDLHEDKTSSQESDGGDVDYNNSELVKCRYYRSRVPKKNDIVAVITSEIIEIGAYVRLVEYDYIEGFITASNVTSKRVNIVSRYLKIGKLQMMEVVKVDDAKMFIDLSKKNIKKES